MKIIIGVIIGSVLGFVLGYFTHCASGTCPLTGNPWVSAILGAALGGIIASK